MIAVAKLRVKKTRTIAITNDLIQGHNKFIRNDIVEGRTDAL